jgi:hypothetical protein
MMPSKENPRDPETPAEWQEAADAAQFGLHLEGARDYGLVLGGPEVDLDRCRDLLQRAAVRGVSPRENLYEPRTDGVTGADPGITEGDWVRINSLGREEGFEPAKGWGRKGVVRSRSESGHVWVDWEGRKRPQGVPEKYLEPAE